MKVHVYKIIETIRVSFKSFITFLYFMFHLGLSTFALFCFITGYTSSLQLAFECIALKSDT